MKREHAEYLALFLFVVFLGSAIAWAVVEAFIMPVHPYVLLIAGCIFFIWSAIVVLLSIIFLFISKHSRRFLFLSFLSGALCGYLAYLLIQGIYPYYEARETLSIFQPVCKFESVAAGKQYQLGGENSVVVIEQPNANGSLSFSAVTQGWTTAKSEKVSVVACAHAWERVVETCKYTGATVQRIQYFVTVTLIEPSSLNIIAEKQFEGDEPKKCLTAVSGSGENRGSKVAWYEVEQWLSEFVAPAD